jgi:prepilin peptidase CpaA
MSIGGGLLTVVMMIAHRVRRQEGQLEIPYGIAIAAATIPELTQRYLYHFGR